MKNKIDYRKYLRSRDWLIKKSKLVNSYLRKKLEIKCFICYSTENLIVHHWDYRNIGNEKLEDLVFMCSDCHKKWHKEIGFKDEWIGKSLDEI